MDEAAAEKLYTMFPVFQSLPSWIQAQLTQEAEYLTILRNQILFDSNNPCSSYPLLLSGSLRVVSISDQGRELLLYRVLPGELCIISSSCMLGQSSYPATGISETDLSLVGIPSTLFKELLTYEIFRIFIFSTFSERMSELMQLVEAVAFLRLDQRLAALLLTKGQEIHLTHQQLADELGSLRELISRLLRRFEDQGAIALQRQCIQILNVDLLRSIAR
jgi:CRP/FNR family transcriptional regulator, anaerobic regulatory protein